MNIRAWLALVVVVFCGSGEARAQDDNGVRLLLARVERAIAAGDAAAYLAALAPSADRTRARDFVGTELLSGVNRSALHERDRAPLQGAPAGTGYSVMVDVIAEFGSRARIATWRLDVKRTGQPGTDAEWTIADQERLSAVENIYKLSLSTAKEFVARNLKISAEDLDLTLPEGSLFVADIDIGTTAVVLLGRGTMNFHPTPATERGQVKIFCGNETLETRFDAAYIRMNPADFETLVESTSLVPRTPDPANLRRAQELFKEEAQKSFVIDLGDLSREAWTLLPSQGDLLAELRTKRFDTLTYAKSSAEAEDITLFDRKRHHNIALYPSKDKQSRRGATYNEDDLVDYDILDYDIEAVVAPDRQWIDGKARIRLKVRSYALGSLTLKLADSLVVQSIVSYEYGRLFALRVKNQNTVVVNLPTVLARDSIMTVTIAYAGRLEPQTADRETVAVDGEPQRAGQEDAPVLIMAEPSFLYSSRSFWYPQAPVSDYATARIRITVPPTIDCVASGELEAGFPVLLPGKDPSQSRKIYIFTAAQPLRYLAFILSRFARAETSTIAFPDQPAAQDGVDGEPAMAGIVYRSLNLSIESNPRQVQRARDLADRSADIALFYESILGDSPYSSFTVALIESDLPGGHSPAYFAALNQQLPSSSLVWRNDPAAFSGYPEFFIAHELAHQWWGQAVGWRNYHEQWLSEGFAQYFAAMYAQHQRGDESFASVMRQLRRWGIETSDQGPIYLGYRLGHIRGESRVFRALVYNKAAAVLHMLRRLIGDDAFFRGLRRFYRESRFRKAGTVDFRAAMERESNRSLERFFDRWIFGSTIPKLKLGYRVEGTDVLIHLEQVGDLFDVPVTVTLQYSDRKPVDVVIPVTERLVDHRVPLEGVLRGVDFSKDDGTLAEVVKDRT